jgi:putative colanic acid biosysnthesis UDP-glucose lipid carrier transferase
MKQPHGSSQSAQQNLISLFTGLIFAGAIALTLQACIALNDHAQFDVFRPTTFVGALAGFVVFSRLNLVSWADRNDIHYNIVMRWFAVYSLVILSGYFSMSVERLSRIVMVSWLVATPVVLSLLALGLQMLAMHVYASGNQRRKAVFLRFHQAAGVLAKRMQYEPLLGVDPIGYFDAAIPEGEETPPLPWLGEIADAVAYVKNNPVDIVFLGLDMAESPAVRELMEALQDSTASIYFIPDSKLFGVPGVQVTEMVGVPLLVVAETPFLGLSHGLKRLMDIVISALLLIALSPVLCGVAVAVKLSSPGPVVFRQKRYGVGGKEIDVYKFRSMKMAPSSDHVKQATQNDDRITRVGRFIRKSSLDELPQFVNVLQGTMSIVGPRPHAVQHNELYRKLIPGYMLRHKVKPGITGWAQVNGLRGETETVDKMRRRIQHDLVYISHWSVSFDIRIILRTALLVFKDTSAY